MASLGCRWIAAVLLGLVLIWPFVLLEALLCSLLGLMVGLLYNGTFCCFGNKARETRAKGCWLLREALLYAVSGLFLCVPFMVLVPFSTMSTSNGWRLGGIPTIVGWVDVNRFLAYRYFSAPQLTGVGSFNDPSRDSLCLMTCCKAPGASPSGRKSGDDEKQELASASSP
eukprot:TRINITY_DN79997_c0_g1_i1.p1 TRINITY_DN79997_c0_g1~~TRINITY_DN79997_c0_g1_i1.p1  ORF type:complete len:170 (+),score=14.71 TRINITY_DN79997_c0_g1_i1:87-596(+)